MQNSGTLKKRKKRTIAKVRGLGIVPYSEQDDTFNGRILLTQNNGSDTRIYMSNLINAKRVTRNPSFHKEIFAGDILNHDLDSVEISVDGKPTSSSLKYTSVSNNRSHLLDDTTVNRLRQLLVLGACSGAFPWSWNKKKYRIDKWGPLAEKLWKVQWTFFTIQTAFLTVFQFYSFINRVQGTNKTYREVFMNSLSVYWYICAVYFNVNMYIYKEQIRHYINTLLDFNKRNVDKFVIDTDGYQDGGRVLINLSIPSNCSQVFASVALFLRMPYQPWYLFSYIYPKPWYWLIPGAIQEFIVVGQVITSFMMTAWIVVAHTNSVDFWLKETHNNVDSDYTIEEIRHPETAVKNYRALQVLCTSFNDCMSPLAIPLVKIHIMTGLIPCGYVLIRSMNQIFVDEFPGILTYPIGVIDCATAGFAMMSMAAEMFDLGSSFVDSWSRTKQKDFRRILMSLPALKVKVGRYYFMTVTTTITFFKATFDYIIDCVITLP